MQRRRWEQSLVHLGQALTLAFACLLDLNRAKEVAGLMGAAAKLMKSREREKAASLIVEEISGILEGRSAVSAESMKDLLAKVELAAGGDRATLGRDIAI
jgi:hypothetical protein